ncbi:MAG: methyltransferase domain-containing protein [Paracoccaceae bacterium]
MHLDVTDLRDFYETARLGRIAKRALSAQIRALWPDLHGLTVVGFGYAAPFVEPVRGEAARTICLMPAQQGVCPWPGEGDNLAALVEETLWPLPRDFADRILLAHGLETCERPHALLEEVARVLAPEGRVLVMAPNRAGLWARRDATPFGFGRPYSIGQLETALAAHGFRVERHEAALYMPPSHRPFWLRLAGPIERAGQRLLPRRVAGVTLIEARKQLFATPGSGAAEAARVPIRVLEGLRPVPAPKPAAGRAAARARPEIG